ncbi:DUF7146 domain-containing protein [Glycocaulis albus]|nr:toprim domain-containing protein [Glycocaulis albus]
MSLMIGRDGRVLINSFSSRTDWRECQRWLEDLKLVEPFDPTRAPSKASPEPRIQNIADRVRQKLDRAKSLWAQSKPLAGTLGGRYAALRGLRICELPSTEVRFHPNVRRSRGPSPAILQKITSSTGRMMGVQCTYLDPATANRLPDREGRRIIGRFKSGGVRLAPGGQVLGVGEGVESTVSAARRFAVPAWALLGSENLKAFTPPAGVELLLIFADHGEGGLIAAETLKARAHDAGIDARILPPPKSAGDWNDLDRPALPTTDFEKV